MWGSVDILDGMAEKALALVVRGTDWSETSRIVTLFTREFGKVRALAKGGRRLKSSFDVSFDLLSVCEIVFLKKASGGLDLLTEARMHEQFPQLRKNLPALYGGYYIAELLADGTQDYDPHPALFENALETLRNLDRHPDLSPSDLLSQFELVWLQELGYSPQLDACAVCARELTVPWPSAVRVGYSPEAGGVVCPECSPALRDRRSMSADARVALLKLAGESERHGRASELPPEIRREVRAVLGYTVSSVLGRRPRLLGYVDGG
jgi:DNA repair protein RecO (recombination protein O)